MKKNFSILALTFLLFFAGNTFGQYSITGIGSSSTYTQNFDAFRGTALTLPTNWAVATASYNATYPILAAGAATPTVANASGNNCYAGRASSSSSDYSILQKQSTSGATTFTFSATNNTGGTINGFVITWNVEQLSAAGRATTVDFKYRLNGGSYVTTGITGTTLYTSSTGTSTTFTYVNSTPTGYSITITGLSLAASGTVDFQFSIANGTGSGSNAHVGIDDFTVYATRTYTVTYDGNGNDGGTVPTDGSSPYTSGATVTVKAPGSMTKTGLSFAGWDTNNDGIAEFTGSGSETFAISANTTLKAVWASSSSPILAITGTPLDHGSVCPTTAATPITYTITNSGGASAAGITVVSSDAQFVVSGLSSTSIAASGGTATYQVTFTPSTAGAKTATITVSSTTSGSNSPTSSLTGTGTATVAQAVSTSAATVITASSATINGNVSNTGTCPTAIEKGFVYSITSVNAAPAVGGTGVTKAIVAGIGTGTYNTGLTGLPSSTQYSFTAYVYDGTTYTYGSTLTFTTSNALTLSGTLAHGSICPGSSTSAITYTITNNSISTVTGIAVGSSNGEFVVSGLSSTSIAASGTATYQVTFTPSASGGRSASISVTSPDATTVSNTVTGIGTATVAQAVTSSAATSVTAKSATLNGNVTNTGTCPAATEKGFVYSITADNANPIVGGSGVTKTAVSGITTGTYTLGLTGLPSSTAYSYKAYVFDGTTYTYSTVQTFNTAIALVISGTTSHGSVCPGSSATPITYTITNNGAFTVAGVAASSSDAQFATGILSSTTIAASGTATYTVTFTPASSGIKNAIITVSSTTPGIVSATSTLSGTGTTAVTQAVTSSAASPVSFTTAQLNGNLNTVGVCPATTEKGFVWSLTSADADPFVGDAGVTKTAVAGIATGTYNLGLTGLANGTNYTFKAYVYNGTTYTYGATLNFTTLVPIANDDCGGAIALTVNSDETCTSTTAGTLFNASSSLAAITCGSFTGTADDDVWYKFTATGTSHIVTVTPAAGLDIVVDVRSGSCNGANIGCADAGGVGAADQVTVSSLTPTSVYYVRVYSYTATAPTVASTFSVCITTPLPVCLDEGFGGGTTTPTTTGCILTSIGGTYTTSGNFGAASPSLQMNATNDRVETPTLSGTAAELSFWIKGQSATGSSLLVEGFNGSWSTVENITSLPTTGTVKTYNATSSPSLAAGFTKFRFTYTLSTGNLSFDDIKVKCTNCTPPSDPNGSITGATSACGSSTLTYTPGVGQPEAGVSYYWQTSASGTSTAFNAVDDFDATSSGSYFVRAKKDGLACWSDAATSAYAVSIINTSTTIAPTTDQNLVTSTNGSALTVTEGSTATRQWMYTTTPGSGYLSFSPVQTGVSYTPNFALADVYYVVSASTYSGCGTILSNEVKITVTAPGPPVITHTPLISTTSTSTQTATATIGSTTALTCATLTYRVDGGTWQTPINGTLSGGVYSFPIPGQAAGSMVEYFITACNIAGNVTSPSGVSTSSPYGSFHEYTINCTPPSSGTQTIAFQGFEFVGSTGYTFSVDNTSTTPTGAQNYPAHPSAVEWRYYNQGANGSISAVNRNSCGCMAENYSGLPAACPDAGNPVYLTGGSSGFCRAYSGNSRGVYLNTSASTENPTASRSRNGSYSYIQQSRADGGVSPLSFIYLDDVAIPDATNATNIKVIVYVSSISTGSLSNGAEADDFVNLNVKYNSSNTINTMVPDPTCGSDLYFFSSSNSASVAGTGASKWDFAGNTWDNSASIIGTTSKNKISINIPNGTTNIAALIRILNDDGGNSELWAIDDVQIIADYPTVAPTTGRYYRSRQNGKWNAISTWEVATAASGPYTNACEFPTYSNSDSIIIMPGHTVRITANQTADQLRVGAGGKLILGNYDLTIYNATGTDFVVNGTFQDDAINVHGTTFNTGATWKYTDGATIIKTNTSSVNTYKDNYEGGISNIPTNADWYFRYSGVGNPTTAASGMFYPNLYFDNTFNSSNFAFNNPSMALSGGNLGSYCTVYGNLNIGTTGTGTVTVYNNNIHNQPMLVNGNITVETGSTLTTAFCSACGTPDLSNGNGTGFEVKGNVTINGSLDINNSNVTPAGIATNTGILKFSGTGTQIVSGSGSSVDLWNIELNKPSQSLVSLNRNISVVNNLNFNSGGIVKTNSNTITVTNGNSATAITGFETPFTASSGSPSYSNDKYVWGNLERTINTNSIYNFPIGDDPTLEGYNPIRFDRKSGTGNATAQFIRMTSGAGSCIIGPIYFSCGGSSKFFQYSKMTSEGKWNMSSSTGTTFGYDIYLHPNQNNQNLYPNEDVDANPLFYKNNYRALKAPNGTTDWSTYAGDPTLCSTCGNICEVGSYYNIPGIGYSGFSDFAPAGGDINSTALPVELTSFTGTCLEDGISQISWTTASEFNSKQFVVQRSEDGVHYTLVAVVPAAGFSNQARSYSITDTSVNANSSYYRLIEVDNNGAQTIYSFIQVKCNEVNGVHVYYTQPKVVVEVNSTKDKQVGFNVYEVSGKLVHQENKQVVRGYNRFDLSIKNKLADGIYIIQMLDGDKATSTKVIVH